MLLQKLRNKRLMFVGDSLNRNQWESMVCLAQSVAPHGRKSLRKTGSLNIFRIEVTPLDFAINKKAFPSIRNQPDTIQVSFYT